MFHKIQEVDFQEVYTLSISMHTIKLAFKMLHILIYIIARMMWGLSFSTPLTAF